jgi:hypothetical protein
MSTPTPTSATPVVEVPNEKVLAHAAKIAMEQDKPLMFDYYMDTRAGGTAFLGEDKDTKERILVKNPEEYTSPVKNMFKKFHEKDKPLFDYIIVTENSVYIVSGSMKKNYISSANM